MIAGLDDIHRENAVASPVDATSPANRDGGRGSDCGEGGI